MQANYISEAISVIRNGYKAAKGDKIAPFVALGHFAKGAQSFANSNAPFSNSVKNLADSFAKGAQESNYVRSAKELVDVTKKSDEIGMCQSAISLFFSSSPIRKTIEEVLGWGTKLLGDYLMLNKLPTAVKNSGSLASVSNKVSDFAKNSKAFGQVPAIISGIAYSAVSIAAPVYARKFGNWISDKLGIKPYKDRDCA